MFLSEEGHKHMEIPQQLSIKALSMISGKLLGDANISIEKNRHPRFRFAHCASDKAWCFTAMNN